MPSHYKTIEGQQTINESSSKVSFPPSCFSSSLRLYVPTVHPSRAGSDDTVVGFHYRTWGRIAPVGLVKQGDEEKSPTYVSHPRPEMTTVNDGFQSAEPPGL